MGLEKLLRIGAAALMIAAYGCNQNTSYRTDSPRPHTYQKDSASLLLDRIPGVSYNEKVIAVDKSAGMLYVYKKARSWKKIDQMSVITGQNRDMKRKEGDLATPECPPEFPYLIAGKMTKDSRDRNFSNYLVKLDNQYGLYGDDVLVLDYPNSHDKRRGLTGSNIWIHKSSGRKYTRGCIGIKQAKVSRLYDSIPVGTKVVIMKSFR